MLLIWYDLINFCAEKAIHGNAWRYIVLGEIQVVYVALFLFSARIIIVHVYIYFYSTIQDLILSGPFMCEEIFLPHCSTWPDRFWMLALTRVQPALQRIHRLLPTCNVALTSYRCSLPRPARTRALAMAHPIASFSHPVQIPALDSPHASDPAKKPKDSKKSKVVAAATGHPLEVSSTSPAFALWY
jgi:hypothetical protein